MNDEIFGDIAIEKTCQQRFGISFDIAEMVVRNLPVGITAHASLFKTTNNQMLLYVVSQAAQLLDDVQKIVARMNLEADVFLPPNAEPEYFDRIGRDKYKVMFPGKHITSDDDLRYYRNLSPYNPALVRIAKVKGEVKGYDPQSRTWHKARDYTFSKIRTN